MSSSEHLSPLTAKELERLRTKQPNRDYPPVENRLVIARTALEHMISRDHIVIPDDPRYHIATHPNRQTPEPGAELDPIASVETPMSQAHVARWQASGLLVDTAGRPLHPHALELLPTIGMFTGPGCFYRYGPQPTGNLALRRRRGRQVEYAAVAVQRRSLTWGLPGGYADPGESPHDAALREAYEEIGVDLRHRTLLARLGRLSITERLHRITCTRTDTAHAWMEEWFTFVDSSDNPSLESIELRPTEDPHIVDRRWIGTRDIAEMPDFLTSHKRMIAQHEEAI